MNIGAAIALIAGITAAAYAVLMTEREDMSLRAFLGFVGLALFAFGVLHV